MFDFLAYMYVSLHIDYNAWENLSSFTRGWAHTLGSGTMVFSNHWTVPREFPSLPF